MDQKLRALTWKYFFEQKWKEIVDFFNEQGGPLWAISFLIGIFLQCFWVTNIEKGVPFCATAGIIGLCIMGFWVMIGLILAIISICKWLSLNWKQAKERAKEEIKKNDKN